MNGFSQRRGSALLIVLGMLAFMVISAVAFSAYMRASRLPSSYLRRVVSSRMLVKAALAQAIDRVDAAIGNNPHPGVGRDKSRQGSGQTRLGRNNWVGRVFIGGSNATVNVEQKLISQTKTVSTLTLEGLAYIPPPLVNEARYYSRRTETAKWQSFDFDAGRYAFTAIDVSDYFDINALQADLARSSNPGERVSLAYLFENDQHTGAGNPAQWDTFMDPFVANRSDVPLVSLADWNLAMRSQKIGDFQSPFYQFILGSGSKFYDGIGVSDPLSANARKAARMTFVTDSYQPVLETTGVNNEELYDLADPRYQPFTEAELKNSNPNFYQVTESSSLGSQRLLKHVPNVALAMLYDYLDEDHVPLSLSIPSVERVPMICGIEPTMAGGQIQVTKEQNPQNAGNDQYPNGEKPAGTTRRVQRTVVYRLKADNLFGGMPAVRALVTYPFRHKDGVSETYTIDGGLVFFFTSGQMGFRPTAAVEGLKFTDDSKFNSGSIMNNSVMVVPFNSRPTVSFTDVKNAEAAVKEVSLTADPSSVANQLSNDEFVLLRVVYEWDQTDPTDRSQFDPWTLEGQPKEPPAEGSSVTEAYCGLRPLDARGAVDAAFTGSGEALVNAIENAARQVRFNVAAYVRVKNANKTVDLVPACGENDKLNGSSNWDAPESQIILQDHFGGASPLMRFDTGGAANTGAGFTFTSAGLQAAATGSPITLFPAAVMIADPRYNYAPESWFQVAAGGISASAWLQQNGAKDRDGDIFMQGSDQNYLQSIYELANLPRVADTGFYSASGGNVAGNLRNPGSFGQSTYAAQGGELNNQFMWKTYDPFPRYRNGGDDFEMLNFVSGGTGFKVNPYTDSTNVMMAVFANTPHDWYVASTNAQTQSGITRTASSFNSQHAWNAYSSGAGIDWEDLEDLAGVFMEELRASPNEDWRDVWNDLGWFKNGLDGDQASQYLLPGLSGAVKLGDTSDQGRIYNTDRKFLYGYWRECFALKQQLFLIFVRAEPAMMGGDGNKTPPQLGGRAVALVWRDPTPTSDERAPHRTRILFYHQFD